MHATFGDRLREIMDKNGLTYAQLAELLGMNVQTLNRYVLGQREPKVSVSNAIAQALKADLYWLQGVHRPDHLRFAQELPQRRERMIPVLGSIPAGNPALALQSAEEYAATDVDSGEEHFFLRVSGDSMIHAGISHGDLVLIRHQSYAASGQIVACMVNEEEATLKRFRQQGNNVILQPENPLYEPRIVPVRDFESGKARIIGVAVRLQRDL
jgi:SOS-response transcriptional repressors (RecA-mediated autopeptidases)